MSELATPDIEAANAFYDASSAGRPTASGRSTLFRLPGFVGGEPSQPVPRDVVAVGQPGDDAAVDGRLLGRRRRRRRRARRRARRRGDLAARRRRRRARRRPRRPAGRDVLGQPGGARMSTIEVVNHVTLDGVMQAPGRPRRGPPRRLRARRLGRRRTSTTSQGEYMGARMGQARRRAAVRPLDLRQDAERLDAAAGGQPGPAGARAQHEVRRLALGRPRRVDELRAAAGRRGRDRRATSRRATEGNLVILGSARARPGPPPRRPHRRDAADDPPARAGQREAPLPRRRSLRFKLVESKPTTTGVLITRYEREAATPLALQRLARGRGDLDRDDLAGRAEAVEVDDLVVAGAAAQARRVVARGALDEHVERAADEALGALARRGAGRPRRAAPCARRCTSCATNSSANSAASVSRRGE